MVSGVDRRPVRRLNLTSSSTNRFWRRLPDDVLAFGAGGVGWRGENAPPSSFLFQNPSLMVLFPLGPLVGSACSFLDRWL